MQELDPDLEMRDYARAPLTRAEIEHILGVVDVADVLNMRHRVAKERGWKAKPPSKAVFTRAALEDNNLLRRPIILRGGAAVVGYDEAAIRELLA